MQLNSTYHEGGDANKRPHCIQGAKQQVFEGRYHKLVFQSLEETLDTNIANSTDYIGKTKEQDTINQAMLGETTS